MNLFKSLFQKTPQKTPLAETGSFAAEVQTFSPRSPRYAYAFPSPYKQPRILILVDSVAASYCLNFHYVLARLHEAESLAFFVLESAEVERWSQAMGSPADMVQQVIEDVQPTLVIFSRYGSPYADELTSLFKAKGIATVCHLDNNLLSAEADVQVPRSLLENSDLIYTSTAVLGDRIAAQFPSKTVFSGIAAPYPDFLLAEPPPPKASPLTLGYAGEQPADLALIAADIARILDDYPEARFEIFGTVAMPESLQEFGDRTRTYKPDSDYRQSLNQLNRLNWDIGLLPLRPSEFNQSKAPVTYIEYSACGIATLASSSPAYQPFEQKMAPDSNLLVAQPGEWYGSLQQLIDSTTLRAMLVNNSQTYCAEAFSLNTLEAKLKELIALV
ncbi:MAG: hypothetical protein WA885_13630 [Phormidesmis sp.]